MSIHTVKSGECLWNIARRNGVSLQALIAANPQIKNPDLIHPGESVKVPGDSGGTASTGGSTAPSSGSNTHKGGLSGLVDHAKDVFTGAVGKLTGSVKDKMAKALSIAKSQVGTLESGWNAGAITKYTGGKTGWPWCAKFFSWVYRNAGMPLPGGDQWGVAGIKSIIQRMGQWKSPSSLEPGMAVTFKGFSHVEMIAKPVMQGGHLVGYMTYGGNTSVPGTGREGVAYKFRSLSIIEGGGYPVHT
ncbi:MAG: LysM peptidoglycan-binding domain-containing protein [Myxococcaceae bacterium]